MTDFGETLQISEDKVRTKETLKSQKREEGGKEKRRQGPTSIISLFGFKEALKGLFGEFWDAIALLRGAIGRKSL